MPAESRMRRIEPGVPLADRVLPGMPLDLAASEDEDSPLPSEALYHGTLPRRSRRRWWRPTGTAGRILLGMAALVVLGSLGTSIYILKTYLGRDSRFRIDETSSIETAGLAEVSRTEMMPIFGEDIGRNVFFVPLSERRKQLEQIPWVQQATVMRLLPGRIRVQIVERQPVAFARQGQKFGLVDGNGVLLTMPPEAMAARHYSFPVVTGINAQDDIAVRKTRMAAYLRLLSELDSSQQKVSEQISEIDLSNPDDLRVLMPEQGSDILAHFGSDHFLERFQHYKSHISEWRQQYPRLAAVDLRYDTQVVLEMQSGSGSESDSAAAKATTDATISGNQGEKTAAKNPPDAANAASHANTDKTASAHGHASAPPKNKAKSLSLNKNKHAQASGKTLKRAVSKSKPTTKTTKLATKTNTAQLKTSSTAHNAAVTGATLNPNQQSPTHIARASTVKAEVD